MKSKRQLAANRANSKKSTGPVTAAGKEAVSQNAVKHGLCGAFHVLACEDQSEYDGLFNRFMETEKPVDDVERELVSKMARHTWMSERAVRFQESCFVVQPQTPEREADQKDGVAVRPELEMFARYQAANDRAYQRASNELSKRRNERRKAEIGFVSQKRAERQEERRDEAHASKMKLAVKKLEQVETAKPARARQQWAAAEPAASANVGSYGLENAPKSAPIAA